MSQSLGFGCPRDFCPGTVPAIFVPVPSVPGESVPIPVPRPGICVPGRKSHGIPVPLPIPGEELLQDTIKLIETLKTNRHRFPNRVLFSIDPSTCTDMDDLLHCHILSNGNFEIGIHIADVSALLTPQLAEIEENAKNRSLSYYLADRTVHMLPEKLANFMSLNPNEDRLAISVVLEGN